MKTLTSKQLQKNYKKLIDIIKDTFEEGSERRERLLKMYHDLEDQMMVAPASGKAEYHYCYVGGYIEHVLHVIEFASKVSSLYESMGGNKTWTDEELIFSAMHHDLGKVGDLVGEYYIPQDNDWRRKTLGEIFTYNSEIQNMRVPDRALFLLQHFGVKCNVNESLSIKLADGLYDTANEYYLKVFNPEKALKDRMPNIIHWADHMATLVETDEWKRSLEEEKAEVKQRVENIKDAVSGNDRNKDLFDELFGDKK